MEFCATHRSLFFHSKLHKKRYIERRTDRTVEHRTKAFDKAVALHLKMSKKHEILLAVCAHGDKRIFCVAEVKNNRRQLNLAKEFIAA